MVTVSCQSLFAKMVRGKSLSGDLRQIIVNLCNFGHSYDKIAERLQLSCYTVRNIMKLYKTTGSKSNLVNTMPKRIQTVLKRKGDIKPLPLGQIK